MKPVWKLVWTLSLLVTAICAQNIVTPFTLADITGDGGVHALASTKTTARTVLVVCKSANSAVVQVGDSNVSSSRGTPCAAGAAVSYPPQATINSYYDLSTIYYLAQSGDKISVQYTR